MSVGRWAVKIVGLESYQGGKVREMFIHDLAFDLAVDALPFYLL